MDIDWRGTVGLGGVQGEAQPLPTLLAITLRIPPRRKAAYCVLVM
jgi:hypothetical protein